MRDKVKEFLLQHLLECAIVWLVAAAAIAAGGVSQLLHGETFQALAFDLPFVLLALFAAYAYYLEWKARKRR